MAFDTLHTEHNACPWDGNHNNGTITTPCSTWRSDRVALPRSAPDGPVLRGAELAFGLTSGAWNLVFGTRFPEADRKRLYGRG